METVEKLDAVITTDGDAQKLFFKTAYGHYSRVQLQIDPEEVGLTKQSFKDECDINKIMIKYQKTGMIAHLNTYGGEYGDASLTQDYHTSLNQVIDAQTAFDSLPSSIRARFQNNPGAFLNFVDNPENTDECIKLGIKHPINRADGLPPTGEDVNPVETTPNPAPAPQPSPEAVHVTQPLTPAPS